MMSQCRKTEGTSFHQTQGEGDEHIGYGVEHRKYRIFLKLSNKFIFSPIDIIILDYFFLIKKTHGHLAVLNPPLYLFWNYVYGFLKLIKSTIYNGTTNNYWVMSKYNISRRVMCQKNDLIFWCDNTADLMIIYAYFIWKYWFFLPTQ